MGSSRASRARAAAIAAGFSLFGATLNPAAAQHEHHARTLDSVTVRAERNALQLRSGATIVEVRGSVAAGGSIADLLRTIPGLELGADGRISMRGSVGALVLMDGRPIPLSGDALGAFLRQMPAASLERVEAGTLGSVRHGADGAAGVVNLVSRTEEARAAVRSVAGSMASDDHYMMSAAVTGSARDIMDWNVSYSLSGMRPRTDATTTRWSVVPGDLPLSTDQDGQGRESHRLGSVLGGAKVAPTRTTSLALRGGYSWMEGEYRNANAFLYTNSEGYTATSATRSAIAHTIPSGHVSAVATIGGGTARLTSEARAGFITEDLLGAHDDADAGYRYMTIAMASRLRERALRNDLALRLGGLNVDVGQESQHRTVSTAHDLTHFNASLSQAYRYANDVHAGYVAAHRSIGGVKAEAGVRIEGDKTRRELDTTSMQTTVRVFPSISGEWTDARRALLYRLAYGRRINRPGAEMLNPFSMGGDDMDEIIGNPMLTPEVSDQVEVGVERHRERSTLQLTPFLRWTRDPIRPLRAPTPSGGVTTTLRNLTWARARGAEGSVRTRPTDGTMLTLAGSVAYMETSSDTLGSRGLHGTARLTMDVRVSEKTMVQLYGHGQSARATEQGEILPTFTSELAITRRVAGDRGRLTVRLSDPLGSDRLGYRVGDATFTQQRRQRTVRPLLSLFASYATGGAPREDEPGQPGRPPRIF